MHGETERTGHAYGDALLAAFAQRLQQQFGDGVTVARMNSNTFGLLGPAGMVRPPSVMAAVKDALVKKGVAAANNVENPRRLPPGQLLDMNRSRPPG